MKLLADENVPSSIVRALEEEGYDIRSIRLDAPGISDIEVMRYAHKDTRVILTSIWTSENLPSRTGCTIQPELFCCACTR